MSFHVLLFRFVYTAQNKKRHTFRYFDICIESTALKQRRTTAGNVVSNEDVALRLIQLLSEI